MLLPRRMLQLWLLILMRSRLQSTLAQILLPCHLLRLVRQHARYYNDDRPHMSLHGDVPTSRAVEPAELGKVIALPRVCGLHHRYIRGAA